MAKDPPSQRYGVASSRFWRNVTLIAFAHVALIVGLIRWSVAARASTNAESIVWLGSAEDLAAGQPENEEAPSAQREAHPIQPKATSKIFPEPPPNNILLAKSSLNFFPLSKPISTKSSDKSHKNEKSLTA